MEKVISVEISAMNFKDEMEPGIAGKPADGSPDGKQSPQPMDTRNTKGVTSAVPAFWRNRIGKL
uniref:SFRICE_034330 n=1 Tax=Spodoptera frugiperda TaxID=7108 RepID=A0A2H1WLQ1_SPOFR